MQHRGEIERYGAVAIALHWAIALLILANWPLGYFGEAIEQRLGTSAVWLHKSIGLSVLALSIARLGWRIANPPPRLPATISAWRAAAARFTHWGFYVLIITLPLTGWLRVSAGKYPLRWFELFELPKFAIAPDSREAEIAAQAHELAAWAMLALVALHVGAALHHHWRLRDAVLLRMLPERRSRRSA